MFKIKKEIISHVSCLPIECTTLPCCLQIYFADFVFWKTDTIEVVYNVIRSSKHSALKYLVINSQNHVTMTRFDLCNNLWKITLSKCPWNACVDRSISVHTYEIPSKFGMISTHYVEVLSQQQYTATTFATSHDKLTENKLLIESGDVDSLFSTCVLRQ